MHSHHGRSFLVVNSLYAVQDNGGANSKDDMASARGEVIRKKSAREHCSTADTPVVWCFGCNYDTLRVALAGRTSHCRLLYSRAATISMMLPKRRFRVSQFILPLLSYAVHDVYTRCLPCEVVIAIYARHSWFR